MTTGRGWSWWFAALAVLWAVCLFVLGLVDDPPLGWSGDDTDLAPVGHLLATFVLAVVAGMWAHARAPGSGVRWALTVGLGGAMLLEVAQLFSESRNTETVDVVMSLVGAGLAALVVVVPDREGRGVGVARAVVSVIVVGAVAATIVAFATQEDPPRQFEVADELTVVEVEDVDDPDAVDASQAAPGQDLECGEADDVAPSLEPVSGPGDPLLVYDLTVDPPAGSGSLFGEGLELVGAGEVGQLSVGAEGTRLGDEARLETVEDAGVLVEALDRTDEVSVVVEVATADVAQAGPSRIVTLSEGIDLSSVNLHVGQQRDGLSLRLRRSCDVVWTTVFGVFTDTDPHLVAVTIGHGRLVVAVDGVVRAVRGLGVVDFVSWADEYRLIIGNEFDSSRLFEGTISSVGIYDVALSSGELAELAADAGYGPESDDDSGSDGEQAEDAESDDDSGSGDGQAEDAESDDGDG